MTSYSMINDAIHGVMSFPIEYKNTIKSLIDSQTFQRLRHIKQLGMTDLVFPTATHNRFSHCLGAAYIALKMSESLGLEEEEKTYAVIGSLLHDIGHGPFSHAFEKLLENKDFGKIKHESWTEYFLKEFEDVFNSDKNHMVDYKMLSSLISKKSDGLKDKTYNLAGDIISSQLDADRMDYLLRDAHFCGVPYGNPDLVWIINHMTTIKETGKPPRLGFMKKGWRAVEHFLLCRRIMTQNVYYHHKKNVLEKLLVYFLIDVSENHREHIANPKLKKFLVNTVDYRQGNLSKERFMQENFPYYKTLTDYDIWMLIRDFSMDLHNESSAHKIAQRLYNRTIHHSFAFEETCLGAVDSIVNNIKKELALSDWEIFITDNEIMAYEAQEDPILILDNSESSHRIQKYSYLLNMIGDKKEKEAHLAIDLDVWNSKKKREEIKDKLKKYISFPHRINIL